MTIPTEEAWTFFLKYKDDIRNICATYLSVNDLQVPNTRLTSEPGDERRGTVPMKPSPYTLETFDKAVEEKNSILLTNIMNRAWLGAPESRDVYYEPGFTEMCNLLDCTVDGFFDDGTDRQDEDENHLL